MGELIHALSEAGLSNVAILGEHDTFRGTNKERTARKFGVVGVDVVAHKVSRGGGRQ